MKKTSCAASAAASLTLTTTVFAFLGAALLGSALLCGTAIADPDPSAAGPATPSAAAPAKGGGELEEIVVTAEKRESTVQATPISITAVSSAELTEKNITNLEDLAASVPGVSMRTAGPGQTEYEMRGLTSAGGSTATVGFYIDEVPLSA
jgi:outer membrane receptor protein involved in Fe transport